jgi:hypothetical protein
LPEYLDFAGKERFTIGTAPALAKAAKLAFRVKNLLALGAANSAVGVNQSGLS